MNVNLLPLSEDVPYLAEAVAVYTEYSGGDPRYNQHFFTIHMKRDNYIGLAAQVNEQIVGIGFGSRAQRGQWWREKVAHEIGDKHLALVNAWVLTQLNVLENYRSQGIGTILHDALIEQQPCAKALLSTPVSNVGAQRFYERHGWTVLHQGFAFARGAEPYMILQKVVSD
jgi:ribosomal protein S18 acetylase RimI-like enzyme